MLLPPPEELELHDSETSSPSDAKKFKTQVMNPLDVKIVELNKSEIFEQNYLKILCNLTDKALEGKLADQKFSTLLIFSYFTV